MKRTSSTMTLNVRTVKAILIIGNHRSDFFLTSPVTKRCRRCVMGIMSGRNGEKKNKQRSVYLGVVVFRASVASERASDSQFLSPQLV